MDCMKCGRDLEEGRAFCESCLSQMERYPVKPGAVVILPRRDEAPAKRSAKRKMLPTPEKLLRKYRRRSRILAGLLVLLLAVVGVGGWFAWRYVEELSTVPVGQNYSSMETGAIEEEN